MTTRRQLLRQTADLAADFIETLEARPVRAAASHADLLAALGGELPARGNAPGEVVARLATAAGSPPPITKPK